MSEQTAVAARPRSILVTMSDRYGMEPGAFEATVRATCMPPDKNGNIPNNAQFAAFLLVANEYGLNPLTKEIYSFPAKGGGIIPILSVDGWFSLINRHPQMDGIDFEFDNDEKGELFSCTCIIWRKDRTRPIRVTEYYDECKRNTEPWQMKRRMLRHKAAIQCARYAFGFAGIYDEDEGEKIAMKDVSPVASTPPTAPRAEEQPARAVEGEILPPASSKPVNSAPSAEKEPAPSATAPKEPEQPKEPEKPKAQRKAADKPKEDPKPVDPAAMLPAQYVDWFRERMFEQKTEVDGAAFWKARRRDLSDATTDALIEIRDEFKGRFAAGGAATSSDNPAPPPAEENAEEEFDPVAFKEAFLIELEGCDIGKEALALKDKLDAIIEQGLLSQEQADEWFEDKLADAITRLPD